jgi:predicted metal-dependent phosphoesterase TrpH
MIDLHLHTTASDGRSTPRELVEHAASAGLIVMAVTDHDTTASIDEVRAHARERGIEVVPGIEITAVEGGRDVHVLGYFLDPADAKLVEFLAGQRQTRVNRARAIAAALAELGMPIDLEASLAELRRLPGRSIGRPQVARAMVIAGHVANTREAFDRWLGRDRPAFIPRSGSPPEDVIAIIQRAGGLASLAHPGRTNIDARIPALRAAGLDAIEVYHSDHDAVTIGRYRQLAIELELLMTGGSDFHGDPNHGVMVGTATLPDDAWQRLHAARHRHVLV